MLRLPARPGPKPPGGALEAPDAHPSGSVAGRRPGTPATMDENPDEPQRPTTNHPLHGERRPLVTPIIGVVALVVLVAAVVLLLTYLRYET